MSWNKNGFSLVELVIALTILALVAAIGVPPILDLTGTLRLYLAAQELSGTLRLARSESARRGFNVAVKFRPGQGGRATYTLYRDGDGDGVLTRDIDTGVDPALSRPRPLQYLGSRMHFGFPPGRKVRDPGSPRQWMSVKDPIRFNNSDLASFGPLGTSTAGSVYLTDGRRLLMAVRVFNRTGKVKIIAYDFEEEVWR
jgi:prepilin-type N-terminal cleavage/methylation domain-containing protein